MARAWVEKAGDDPGAKGLIEYEEAHYALATGRFHDGLVGFTRAADFFRVAGHRWRRIRALHGLATALGLLGRLEETISVARRALDLVQPEEESFPLAVELEEGLRIAKAGPDHLKEPDGDGR